PEERADPLLLVGEQTDVRLHELLDADRREDALPVGELRAVEMVDVEELALVEHAEVPEQPLDHLALREDADRRVERVLASPEGVGEPAGTFALLHDEGLVAVLGE